MVMANVCSPEISRTIANLRLPMMLGVVLIHNVLITPADAAERGMGFVAFFIELMSHRIVAPCVPLFFFFSGYLFFLKSPTHFGIAEYRVQVRKRMRTLLLPFVFWNALVLAYFAMMHKFTPSLINPEFNNVCNYTVVEWLRSFWDFPGGQPVCYQFWFLRDLIIAVVCSPLIYKAVKYGRSYLVAIMCCLYIYRTDLFPYQMMLTFFPLGAYFAIHKHDFVDMAEKCYKISLPVFGCLVILCSANTNLGGQDGIITLTGSASYIWLASKCCKYNIKSADSSFFIYAFHGFPILILSKFLVRFVNPSSPFMWLVCYAGCFVFIVALSMSLYNILKKMSPKFTAIITGGR